MDRFARTIHLGRTGSEALEGVNAASPHDNKISASPRLVIVSAVCSPLHQAPFASLHFRSFPTMSLTKSVRALLRHLLPSAELIPPSLKHVSWHGRDKSERSRR